MTSKIYPVTGLHSEVLEPSLLHTPSGTAITVCISFRGAMLSGSGHCRAGLRRVRCVPVSGARSPALVVDTDEKECDNDGEEKHRHDHVPDDQHHHRLITSTV